ncbi:MAG: hypothetical protein PHS04_02805, partial [Tissierellia bacterium]|nr:hypothetical protein [Tissierellia bacterium]
TNDRMIDDIRREMQQRGVVLVPGSSSMTQIINQYGQSQKGVVNDAISERYDSRRADLQQRMSREYEDIDKQMEDQRKSRLASLGADANDPFYRSVLDQQIEQQREAEYKRVGRKFDAEENDLIEEEKTERSKAEAELTSAIKELTEYFNRQSESGTSDSHIGRLRAQQKALILERDSAETEVGAMDAGKRLADVNEQLRRALSGGGQVQGKPYYDSMLQGSQGLMGMFSGLQSGDLSGTIMGGGSAIAGLSGMGLKTALKFLGWVGLAAGAGKMMVGAGESYENMSNLAALRSTSGLSGGDASRYLGDIIPDASMDGTKISDYGFKADEFGGEAARRIKARGTSEDWFAETLRQVGLERNLSLQQGSLQEGGRYDRYGTNVTDALMRMVSILSNIEGSGISMNDFTRVQEKYDIQQQLMGSYMNRADKPNYDVANQTLAAFSSVQGITQDSRIGTDIQSFQSMIQNPMNERMRALIYSSVSDLFPETGGRMDLIDRELRNPENEGKIMQAVIQRITSQFGGTDTQMGYFAFKSLLPDIAPDRLDEYVNQFTQGGDPRSFLSGDITNQGAINEWAKLNKDAYAIQSTEFLTTWSKGKAEVISKMNEIIGKMIGTTTNPVPNTPKPGGNK